jgi:hypothetical protein
MALLRTGADAARARTNDAARVFALLLTLAVAACALVSAFVSPGKPFVFSHRVHVTDEGLECAGCHSGAATTDDPGMPVLTQCQLCHETIDAEKPPERKVATLFEAKGWRSASQRMSSEIVFSHQSHAAAGRECNSCHLHIESDDGVEQPAAMTMSVCVACHAQQSAANECATCHREIRVDRAPPTHAFAWQRLHGKAVRAHGTEEADRCSLCHQESSCVACHMDVSPGNHNNYFRLRGHGLFARMDRQNCAACHRSDSCDSCHRDARPVNHIGAWGGLRNNHCISCHQPLVGNECSTCHRDANSHALAAPLPPGHSPAMNCRQCHGLTAPLPHVDNGGECILCHR